MQNLMTNLINYLVPLPAYIIVPFGTKPLGPNKKIGVGFYGFIYICLIATI